MLCAMLYAMGAHYGVETLTGALLLVLFVLEDSCLHRDCLQIQLCLPKIPLLVSGKVGASVAGKRCFSVWRTTSMC